MDDAADCMSQLDAVSGGVCGRKHHAQSRVVGWQIMGPLPPTLNPPPPPPAPVSTYAAEGSRILRQKPNILLPTRLQPILHVHVWGR